MFKEALEHLRHGDPRNRASVLGELGTLAVSEGKYDEAQKHYKDAQNLFQMLDEPAMEATTLYWQGWIAEKCYQLQEAEQYYRKSLTLCERNEVATLIPEICNALAIIAQSSDRPDEAESWYKQALARETYAAYERNRYDIDQQFGPLILGIVAAAKGNPEARRQVLPALEGDSTYMTTMIHRIWAGERDWHALAGNLNLNVESALLGLRVLELLSQPTEEPEQLIASLPVVMHQAMRQKDLTAFKQALDALPLEKQMAVMELLL
jgi:tetratricopeptide (TPR) repeat protein